MPFNIGYKVKASLRANIHYRLRCYFIGYYLMLIWAAQQHFLPKLVQDQQLQTLIYLLTFNRIEDYLQQFLRHFYSNYVLSAPPPPRPAPQLLFLLMNLRIVMKATPVPCPHRDEPSGVVFVGETGKHLILRPPAPVSFESDHFNFPCCLECLR